MPALPRTLSGELASRILDRDVDGYEPLRQITACYAAERGVSQTWRGRVSQRLRLVLAARNADGDTLVAEEQLDGMDYGSAIADVPAPRRHAAPPPAAATYIPGWARAPSAGGAV